MSAIVACAVMPSGAGAILIHGKGTVLGHPRVLSITPRAGVTARSLPPSLLFIPKARIGFASNGNLDYNGGGVFHSQAPYVIFWDPGSGISGTTESLIERYFTDAAHDSGLSSNVYGVVRQYWDSHGFANYAQSFSASTQAFVDTDAYPTSGNCPNVSGSFPTCVTDAQVQAELASFVSAHGLPNDGADPTNLASNAPEYFVVLPTNVNECAGSSVCASTSYCAYHAAMPFGSNGLVYAMIPLLGSVINFGSGSGKGCQFDGNSAVQAPNGDQQADISLKYISHEQAESITDPLPPDSWISLQGAQSGHSGGEIGDQCNTTGSFNPNGPEGPNPNAFLPVIGGSAGAGTLFDQLDNGHPYYIQSEWSNGNVNCELRPTSGAMASSIGGPATATPVGSLVTLTPSATSSNGFSSVTVDFGDGTAQFDHSGAAPAPVSHTYGRAGIYNAKLEAVDPMGNITQASRPVTVGSPPHAAFSASPSTAATGVPVKFKNRSSDPDGGVTLSSFAFAFGDGHSGTGSSTTHAFKRPGTYTVTFAVTNSLNLQAMVSRKIKIVKATITKLKLGKLTNSSAIIVVKVNAPGKLVGIGKTKKVKRPGTYRLKVTFPAGARTITADLKFVPTAGTTVKKTLVIHR
jgi:hypothetical protein